MFVIKGNLHNY